MYDFPPSIGTNRHEDDLYAILARLERTPLPQKPIAFYGSSSFRLWPSMAQDLGSLDIVNLGFGGGTSVSGLHYLEKLVVPLQPEKIVLYFGENDIANDGLTGNSTFLNLCALHAAIGNALPQAQIFILSTKQSPTRWIYADEVDQYNAATRSWCKDQENTTFIEASAGLLGENGLPMGRYYQPDYIHLNGGGYAIWSAVLREFPGLLPGR